MVAEEPSSSNHDVSNNPSNSIELPVMEMEVLTYDQCMVDPSGYDVSLPVDIIENINQNVEINQPEVILGLNNELHSTNQDDVLGRNPILRLVTDVEQVTMDTAVSELEYSYEEETNTSIETIPYECNTPDLSISSDHQNSLPKEHSPIPCVEDIWKQDARKRKWTVSLKKLGSADIYELSCPTPKWDEIDPYSSLDEYSLPNEEVQRSPSLVNPTASDINIGSKGYLL